MAIEIVDFPIKSMVIFHGYVNVYRRVYTDDDILWYAHTVCNGHASIAWHLRLLTSRKHENQLAKSLFVMNYWTTIIKHNKMSLRWHFH